MGEAFMSYHPNQLVRDYDDRGMMKWLGFYLSEHTSEMEKDSLYRNTIWQYKITMSDEEINSVLKTAYTKHKTVNIQLDSLDSEGHAFADIIGTIEGFQDNKLYIFNIDDGIQVVSINSINHISLSDQAKWSEV